MTTVWSTVAPVESSRGWLVPGLRAARKHAALTQEELAAAAGLTGRTVGELERGARGALPTSVRALAKALGVTPARLYAAPEASQ